MPRDSTTQETKVFRYSWRPALTIVGGAIGMIVVITILTRGFSAVGAGIILAVSTLFASYFAFLAMRVKLIINPEGVTFYERGQTVSMTWENIHAVATAAVAGRNARQYNLLNHGNVVLSFENEIANSERAYRTIERRIGVDLYPRYREALERGDVIRFGVVNLAKSGLNVRHVNLAVNEARLVRDGTALTVIKRATGEIAISVDEGDVPNINILMRAASELDPQLVGGPKGITVEG